MITGIMARLRKSEQSANARSQKMAILAFVIRVGNAGIVFVTQVLLAHWMGAHEFGIYVYVWTLLFTAADIVHFGLPLAAQRFIPQYRERNAQALLRGYLSGSCWFTFFAGILAGGAGAIVVYRMDSSMEPSLAGALYFACAALPFHALTFMTDGLARSFNWIGIALLPAYVVRPLLFVGAITFLHFAGFAFDAARAMVTMALAGCVAVIFPIVSLFVRLRKIMPWGKRHYDLRVWISTSLPMVLAWGLFTLLISTDVIVLKHFRSPEEVAHYFAAAKTVALVAIIYFAVAGVTAHRFTTYAAIGDRGGLATFATSTVHWIFWPSLALGVALIMFGPLVLRLFGEDFVAAYPTMAILVVGHLTRASVGPAERILNMLGRQHACLLAYATAVIFNIGAAVALVPEYGGIGAAVATTGAIMVESALLFWLARKHIGLHLFIWRWRF